jgi:hypothetical protein
VGHYIAYATEAGTTEPREMLAQVDAMLTVGLWGIPSTALLKAKLLPGDGLIVAVGAPYRRFVGDGVLASRYRLFTEEEAAQLPPGLEFGHGVTLTQVRIWPVRPFIDEVWPRTMAAKRNPAARFFGAISSVRSVDAAVIVAAGAGERQQSGRSDQPDVPVRPLLEQAGTNTGNERPARERDANAYGQRSAQERVADQRAQRTRPVLEPRLAGDFASRALQEAARSRAGLPVSVGHADWGKAAAKCVVSTAELHGGVYRARPPAVVGRTGGLIERMGLRGDRGKGVLLGFDFPIGVPRAYARLAGFDNFADWFRALDLDSEFFEVAAELSQVSRDRPFFPTRISQKTPGVKALFHTALGLSDSEVLRRTDRAHCRRGAASEMFWALGAQAVGNATLAGWKQALCPALAEPGRTYSIWPFDGRLTDLLERSDAVIVETYPREAYGQLGLRIGSPGTAKTRQSDRRADALQILQRCAENAVLPDDELTGQVLDGFGSTAAGEDLFDAVVGLIGMIQTLRRAPEPDLPNALEVRQLEGWMFGQHAECDHRA